LRCGFFEVAVPPEPYYNAANLEKAPTSVKRKEFLLSIDRAPVGTHASHQ